MLFCVFVDVFAVHAHLCSQNIICMKLIGAWFVSNRRVCRLFQKRNRSNHFPSLWSPWSRKKWQRKNSISHWHCCWCCCNCFLLLFHHVRQTYDCWLVSFWYVCLFSFACLANIKTGTISCVQSTEPKHFECIHQHGQCFFLPTFFLYEMSSRKSGFRMWREREKKIDNTKHAQFLATKIVNAILTSTIKCLLI